MIEVGTKAPDFALTDQHGVTHSLSQYLGQKIVLYFYPKDSTPTCTTQACNLRDNLDVLKDKNIIVLGVSADSVASHEKFSNKQQLNFPILSDENKEVVTAYGVWGEKKFMGKTYMGITRTTFLLNEAGVVEHVIAKIKAKEHGQQILETWGL